MTADSEAHVIIVTGAGGGLGSTMTRGLLAAGRRVAAVDLVASGLAALPAGERLLTLTGDIRDAAACARIVADVEKHFGAVHGLINNAAIGPWYTPEGKSPRFYELPAARWQQTIDTNVNGTFLMTHAVAPRLIAGGWGRIVNVTTSLATMTMGGMAPYGPSKAAIEGVTGVMAADLAGTGVSANVLVPGGAADTQMVPQFAAPDRTKLISPQVMVAPIVWLTSRSSDGVTARRFIGIHWDPTAAVADNLRTAGAPVAWPG
jgi:NAD(P)-dependent dehydrogenase (short-subunit alcohol dehydrogenase family)